MGRWGYNMIPVYQEVIFNWQLDCALLAVAILERWLLIIKAHRLSTGTNQEK